MKNEIIELAITNPVVYAGLTKIRLGVREVDSLCEMVVALVQENENLTKALMDNLENMNSQESFMRFIKINNDYDSHNR